MRHLRPHSRGFTLVELLISLGISLLLIYGINLVFRAVTDTVRVGNALAAANRKMRSVESSVVIDFEGTFSEVQYNTNPPAVGTQSQVEHRWSGIAPVVASLDPAVPYQQQPRQPAITIFCKRQIAFMNKADAAADLDGNPATYDESGSGTEGTDFTADLNRIGPRVHRLDTIGFFSGGSFTPRAIPGPGASASGDAPQAWVWYGHCLQHDSAGDLVINDFKELKPVPLSGGPLNPKPRFYQPGQADATANPRNYYATDWVLGRMAITLLPRLNSTPTMPGTPTLGTVSSTVPINVIFGETGASPTVIDSAATLVQNSASSTFAPTPAVEDSIPVDTAYPNGAPFTSALCDVAGVWPGLTTGTLQMPTGYVGTDAVTAYDLNKSTGLLYRYYKAQSASADWYQKSTVQDVTTATDWLPLRFDTVQAFGRPVQTEGPLNATNKAALQATGIAKGCTQFIVEFAGDFVTQGSDGSVTSGSSVPTPDGVLDFTVDPVTKIRRTKWYGLERDLDGNGTIEHATDVEPVFKFALGNAPMANSFEKSYSAGDHYVVAFGPNDMYPNTKTFQSSVRPWMIRLTVTLNDSNNNLPSGLTREFVFKVR